jgi:uncharacterized membrane protein
MFSIKESLKSGWQKSKEHMELVLFATLLVLAVGSLTGGAGDHKGFSVSLLGILAVIFSIIIRIGYIKIFLRIHDGQTPKFVEIFEEYRTFWRFLGTSILTCLAVLGGLILLIIPGIFWAVRFSLSPLIIVDGKMGPVVAMKESYHITKGHFWKLLGFWIVVGLVNLLGLICLGVGLIVTVPVTTLASVYAYRSLISENHIKSAQEKIKSDQNSSPQGA